MTENIFTFNKDEVNRIKLETAVLPLKVNEVEGTSEITIKVKCDENVFHYECKLKDGKLKLAFENVVIKNPFKARDKVKTDDSYIFVEIPTGMAVEKFKVLVAASTAEINLPTIEVSKKTRLEIGAGDAKINGLNTLGTTVASIGAGRLEMVTPGSGSYEIECGMGSVDVALGKDETNYNFAIDCGLGAVMLNGKKIGKSFASNNVLTSSTATGNVNISCGMGKVGITTLAI